MGYNCHKKRSWDVSQRHLMENLDASAVVQLFVTVIAHSKFRVQGFPSLLTWVLQGIVLTIFIRSPAVVCDVLHDSDLFAIGLR